MVLLKRLSNTLTYNLKAFFKAGFIITTFFCASVYAEELSINVKGLFKNTAIVEINGVARTLKVGKPSPEGVVLLSANSRKAVIRYKQQQQTLVMGSSSPVAFNSVIETSKATKRQKVLNLIRQPDGMFRVAGTINNTQVNFLVDTGATSIAMNHHTADRIGIPYRSMGQVIHAETASGVVKAYRVSLAHVRVGDLELRNVDGAVLVGSQPSKVLLGMSFLGNFKVEQDGNKLVIGTRY